MCVLILEDGMFTVSWYAELALRIRVSMSATGSVMVMAWWPSSPRFPCCLSCCSQHRDLRRGRWGPDGPQGWSFLPGTEVPMRRRVAARSDRLPAGLGDAGKLAPVRHRPEADPAQAEALVDRARPAAAGAPRVGPHLVLGLALRLGDEALLRHCSVLLEREAEPPQERAALFVIGRGRDNGHVHAALPVHLIGVDLVEHQLLGQPER